MMFDDAVKKFPFFYYLLRFSFLVLIIFLLPLVFSDYIKNAKSKAASGLLSISIVFLFIIYLSEAFLTFYPETNGKNDTYCSKTWMYYYWKLNKLGFRDIEFETMDTNKPAIVFAGDSYTEGHGIKNPSNRVSDIIRKEFKGFNIYNIGKNGMDINDELKLIKNMPIRPQILVLQICSNDWDYLNKPVSLNTPKRTLLFAEVQSSFFTKYFISFNYLSSKLENLIANSFSSNLSDQELNKIYTSFKIDKSKIINSKNNLSVLEYAVANSPMSEDSIQSNLFKMFKQYNSSLRIMTDSLVFSGYLNKLAELKRFCDTQDATLIVVPYPNMDDFSMKIANKYTNRYLCNLISKQGINCLDVFPNLKKANLSTYTVNKSDNHANEDASKIIADTLIRYIRTNIAEQ